MSWQNPLRGCWSVHLRSTECPQIYANGKGASQLASQASALFEFFERLATNLFFADYYLGQDTAASAFVHYPQEKWFPVVDPTRIPTHRPDGTELLNAELREFYGSSGELTPAMLHDNNSANEQRGVSALPFLQLGGGETVYFPVSILNNLYGSNGMAAGNSASECRAQALAEILERHVKNNVIANGLCLPDVPQAVIDRYPQIRDSIAELRARGFSVLVKDASLAGKYPVVCVLLVNPEHGGCWASFGASCRFEVALERTVTELLQGRTLDELGLAPLPSHDLDAVADSFNLESHFIDSVGLLSWRMFGDKPDFVFCDWDFFEGSSADEYDRLRQLVGDLGHAAYCADYLHCGLHACRIIVPGMSEIYPLDDLVYNNKTTGAALRARLLRLRELSRSELRELDQELAELGLNDQQPVSDLIGVIFAEDSAWSALRVGELKAMLALAAGDLEGAAAACRWCHESGLLPAPRQRLYRAIDELIRFALADEDPASYGSALAQFFGDQTVTAAQQIVSGSLTFHGLDFADSWEALSAAHRALLALYGKVQRLKQA